MPRETTHPALKDRPMLKPLLSGWLAWKYRAVLVLWFALALWFWVWWLDPSNVIGAGRYWFVTAGLAWIWGMQLYFAVVFLNAHRSAAPDPEPGRWRVAMIVTKTPSEPFDVARRTLEAMLAQDYPHDTWLADEAPTPETRVWCAAHGVRISSRNGVEDYHQATWPRRTRCKEGNLSYFYDHWGYEDYDIVSQLDTDHVPQPGYLREMLRPFADPEVGYVSAPSICAANADGHWAARTRLYSEAAFHGVFQAGYSKVLTPMCIGSHYAVRTSALKQAGGLGPELAEDHSTTMLIAAAGWRGVHAIDATAIGDGPASLPDLVTQEFQWSRSLLTLLLRYTPAYLAKLPLRLKFLFLLCQSWYLIFALTMAMMYLLPILALSFDIRFADVTYPAFLAHSLPAIGAMILFAYLMRRDGFLRPVDAKVLAWEKILFVALQWPWVFWGVTMAIRDRLTGSFVDFRITPKGKAAEARLPFRIVAVYAALALGALIPVALADEVAEARGFYILSAINGAIYVILLLATFWHHLRSLPAGLAAGLRASWPQLSGLVTVALFAAIVGVMRFEDGVQALAYGLEPTRVVKAEYIVAGAGAGQPGEIRIRFTLDWLKQRFSEGGEP